MILILCLVGGGGVDKQLQDLLEACAWEEVLIVSEFCCLIAGTL